MNNEKRYIDLNRRQKVLLYENGFTIDSLGSSRKNDKLISDVGVFQEKNT